MENRQYQSLKTFTKVIIFILAIVNIIFLFFLYDGEVRYNFSRLSAEAHNIYTGIKLRRTTGQRDFPGSVLLLNKQLEGIGICF